MRNIYWLAKEDIASLKYNYLYVRENAKYTSPEVVKEMVFVISQCIKNDIQQELQQSPFYRNKDMKIHDRPKLCEFKKAYDEGDYVLCNIKDSTSQRSSFDNTRLEFLTKLEKNLLNRLIDTSVLSAFKIINPRYFLSTIDQAATFGEELEVISPHIENKH